MGRQEPDVRAGIARRQAGDTGWRNGIEASGAREAECPGTAATHIAAEAQTTRRSPGIHARYATCARTEADFDHLNTHGRRNNWIDGPALE